MTAPVIALLPTRYASTRLPAKALLCDTGKPLIQHAYEAVKAIPGLDRIVIACDDTRIEQAARNFGAEVVMTRADHPNGTSRLSEAADILGLSEDTIVLNAQGDEPELEAEPVQRLLRLMRNNPDIPMGTVGCPLGDATDIQNPNIVKLVVGIKNQALYFSRSPVPFDRQTGRAANPCLKHLGLYAYRRHFLRQYPTLSETPLENLEKLEQLRVLEHGFTIGVVEAPPSPPGIDTQEQYDMFVSRWQSQHSSEPPTDL